MNWDASLEQGPAYRGLGLTSRLSRRPCCKHRRVVVLLYLVSKLLATLAQWSGTQWVGEPEGYQTLYDREQSLAGDPSLRIWLQNNELTS